MLLLFIFVGIPTVFAQQAVDESSFETALKTIREKTRVPLKMPTYFTSPAYFTAPQKRTPLTAVVREAATDSFEFEFCLSESCRSEEFYGSVSGEKSTADKPKFDKTFRLAQGITGFYQKATCGASCGDAILFWEQNGYRYAVSLHSADDQSLIKFADSAIINVRLEIPGKADARETRSIDECLATFLEPGYTLEFESRGDLNGDSLADWTGIVQRKKASSTDENSFDPPRNTQLLVLLRQPQGKYVLAAASKESIFLASNSYIEGVDIERASVYLQINASGGYASFSQFRLYRNEWRLVGWREVKVDPEADTSFEKDRNLLTGAVIETRQKGERKPVYKRYQKKFPLILLSKFDLFGWNEIE